VDLVSVVARCFSRISPVAALGAINGSPVPAVLIQAIE
jgi:hypothetical protein